MNGMTCRQRVLAALRKEPVDRVPVFMWFHPETSEKLGAALDIPAAFVGDAMGNDIRQTWVGNNYAMEGVVHGKDGEGHTDEFGIRWVKDGCFNQIVSHPLEKASPEELLAYKYPSDRIDEMVSRLELVVKGRGDMFLGVDVSPCAFEMLNRLRGMEGTLLDLLAEPEVADTMLSRCAGFSASLAERALERYALDWLWTGDDLASQNAMMMSPDIWRGLIKPHLAKVVAVGKRKGLPVAFHSCGSIRPVIPDLIEIGVTVLNPIQCNCPGMEPLDLKREFGTEISFMGGVDTQGVLPCGTAAQVRKATERLINGMTIDGGGYILAASHTVPPETPIENIFAMYEAAGISRAEIHDRAVITGLAEALPTGHKLQNLPIGRQAQSTNYETTSNDLNSNSRPESAA
jgi:uroporphyrinogen decarboxylase